MIATLTAAAPAPGKSPITGSLGRPRAPNGRRRGALGSGSARSRRRASAQERLRLRLVAIVRLDHVDDRTAHCGASVQRRRELASKPIRSMTAACATNAATGCTFEERPSAVPKRDHGDRARARRRQPEPMKEEPQGGEQEARPRRNRPSRSMRPADRQLRRRRSPGRASCARCSGHRLIASTESLARSVSSACPWWRERVPLRAGRSRRPRAAPAPGP